MFKFSKKTKEEPKDLKEVLKHLKRLEESHEKISRQFDNSLQKIGIVRFNPFEEIGGDQSFSIALLDAHNNGFIITSLYGREANRVYAKPVKNGSSVYSLAKEEKEALNKAIRKNNEKNS